MSNDIENGQEIFDLSSLKQNEAIRLAKDTTDVDVIISLSKHPNPHVRKASLREMCPCRVKEDIDRFWKRVIEMHDDEDSMVRAQVLHTCCDGSPNHLENEIIECIEKFNHDPDSEIRRKAHKVISSYRRTGKWNIL